MSLKFDKSIPLALAVFSPGDRVLGVLGKGE